jgi:hypothetical protein
MWWAYIRGGGLYLGGGGLFELLANREIHNYNTRYKDNLRPPKVSRNWGKQRLAYQAITDWNNLDRKIKLSTSISTFKRNFFSNL